MVAELGVALDIVTRQAAASQGDTNFMYTSSEHTTTGIFFT